jgi:TonB family protein
MKTFRFLLLLASLAALSARAADAPAPAASTPAATAVVSGTIPCKIHRTTPVRYPVSLMREGISHGEARVLINIDANGRLTESMVLAYTQKPFADAAMSAISEWRYEAARIDGETVGTVADITFRFEVDGVLLVERIGIPHFPQNDTFDPAYIYKPHGLRTLDGIPTPIQVTQPIYPKEWIDQGMRGNVLVDFYIDETGAVRMPSVASTQHPYLAAAAAAAVREWRFAPPLRKGRPVLAHCQQIFKFEPETPKLSTTP